MTEDEAIAYAERLANDPAKLPWAKFIPLPASQIMGEDVAGGEDWVVACESSETGEIVCFVKP